MSTDAHPDIRDEKLPFGSGWLPGENAGSGSRRISIRSVKAPGMGTWKVNVRHSGAYAIFGQRRNLHRLSPDSDETSFYTCLTPYIPSMSSERLERTELYASVAGGEILSMEIKPTSVRNVMIAGDSTVADQSSPMPWYPYDSYCGWGQMLPLFLPGDAVCNQAHSGMTSRCFQSDGHFGIIMDALQPSDLVLMQFGHNDQKRRALQPDGYRRELLTMIKQIRARHAQPVLLSPVSRVPSYDKTGAFDLLAAHSEAVRELAREQGLPFIDLHSYTFERYVSMGEGCRDLFKPGDGTHSNDYGAYEIAKYVAQQLGDCGLAAPVFPSVSFCAENDRARNSEIRLGTPLPVPYLDLTDNEDRSIVQEAVQKGLLDPCVLYMHPRDPLPRAQFMQLLFRRSGLKGVATNGEAPFPDVGGRDWEASTAAACRALGLVAEPFYRPDDMITGKEAAELCCRARFSHTLPDEDRILSRYEIVRGLLGR